MNSVSFQEIRDKIASILQSAHHDNTRYRVAKRGKEVAAIVSIGDLERLERFEDQMFISSAKKGLDALKSKGAAPLAELLTEDVSASPYHLEISPQIKPAVKKHGRKLKQKLAKELVTLTVNPHSHDAKKVRGMVGLRRLFVGQFVVLYKVEEKRPSVIILSLLADDEIG